MLKPRRKLIEIVEQEITKTLTVLMQNKKLNHANELASRYGIPLDISQDYLSGIKPLDDASDFLLFALLNVMNKKLVPDYFSDEEIGRYSNTRFELKPIENELKFDVVQVALDQWIGIINVQKLKEFRDAQIVQYNPNTQRTMTRITVNGEEHYKITINRKAIEGIKQSFLNNIYIPNTITFNIPEEAYEEYNEQTKTLSISNIDHMDILDGYHRYIALSEIFNEKPDFDYTMELRIVKFGEKKAKQFIWQEDQKTQMSRLDSAAFNQYNVTNTIIQRLNSNILQGAANSNGGIIDPGVLTLSLNLTYCKNAVGLSRSEEVKLAKKVESDFTQLFDNDPSVFDKKWNRNYTLCAIYSLYRGNYSKQLIDTLYEGAKEKISKTPNKRDISRIQSVYNEVTRDV